MKTIKPRKSKQLPVEFYSPENVLVATIDTLYEFNDIRVQIKENKAEGYYFVFEGQEITIDKDGRLPYWPEGFFDENEYQLMKLI